MVQGRVYGKQMQIVLQQQQIINRTQGECNGQASSGSLRQ